MCCCCGKRSAHIASIILLAASFIFMIAGFAGVALRYLLPYVVEVDYGAAGKCDEEYTFFWSEFEAKTCSLATTRTELNKSLTRYKDCDEDFCSKCETSGEVIATFLTFALIAGIGSLYLIYLRLDATLRGRDLGCTKARTLASVVVGVMAFFLYIWLFSCCIIFFVFTRYCCPSSWQVWIDPCQFAINDFIKKRDEAFDNLSFASADHYSGSGAGAGVTFTALILVIIAAANQCCATDPEDHDASRQATQPGPEVNQPRRGPLPPGMVELAEQEDDDDFHDPVRAVPIDEKDQLAQSQSFKQTHV